MQRYAAGGTMQASATDASSRINDESNEPIRVWIEHEDGSIARGLIERLSGDGALVRLLGEAPMVEGDVVAVRIAYSRRAPTLAATARVSAVLQSREEAHCTLAWTHSGREREQLARLQTSSSS